MEQNAKRIRDIYNYYLIDEITMPKKYYDIGDESVATQITAEAFTTKYNKIKIKE